MKKTRKITVAIISTLALLCAILFCIYLCHLLNIPRRASDIPSLTTVAEQGGAFAYSRIVGYEREQLLSVWGEPTESFRSSDKDIWRIDENSYLIVHYNWIDQVSALKLIQEK